MAASTVEYPLLTFSPFPSSRQTVFIPTANCYNSLRGPVVVKAKSSFSLKDQLFNLEKVDYLGGLIGQVYADFDQTAFHRDVVEIGRAHV